MRDKDGIILESLYTKVLEGAKTKSKKQVGLLLSKGSPLTKKQQDKLKGELHSGKVKVEESFSEHDFDIEVGEGGLNPRDGANEIDRASVIEVKGKKYIVSGIVGVTPEYEFQKAEPENAIGAGWNQLDTDLDIDVHCLQIQTTELVSVKDGLGRDTKEYKFVYDMTNHEVTQDELNDPEVVQAAIQEIEKRIIKHNHDHPELYDKEYDNDYDPEEDRDWERD
jgi:hypothetical protein